MVIRALSGLTVSESLPNHAATSVVCRFDCLVADLDNISSYEQSLQVRLHLAIYATNGSEIYLQSPRGKRPGLLLQNLKPPG